MDSIKNFANNLTNREQSNPNQVVPVDEDQPLKGGQTQGFSSLANGFNVLVGQGMNKAKASLDEVQSEIKKGFGQLDEKLKSALKQYSNQINIWARTKVIGSIIQVLEKMRPIAKDALKDPDMCYCVQNLVDDTVDGLWPEVMDEVRYELMMNLYEPYVEIESKKTIACCYPIVMFRNWYLYATQPFDRSIWKQFKTFSYWFWTLVSAVPYYGVSQYFYVYDFINIDKSDEYQLVRFILSFKTMFFITQGVMKALIGYFMLYACATLDYNSTVYQSDTCIRKGPGNSIEVFSEVIGQACQVLLIWIAFFMIPCSTQKGRPVFLYEDQPRQVNWFEKGGRLKYFMFYDFFALGASIGLFWLVYLIQSNNRPDFENSGDFIYFSEICYGLLSFPFLLFNLPFISDRLTLAKPTAYDRKGNCLPDRKGLKTRIQSEKISERTLLSSISLDVNEVFDG